MLTCGLMVYLQYTLDVDVVSNCSCFIGRRFYAWRWWCWSHDVDDGLTVCSVFHKHLLVHPTTPTKPPPTPPTAPTSPRVSVHSCVSQSRIPYARNCTKSRHHHNRNHRAPFRHPETAQTHWTNESHAVNHPANIMYNKIAHKTWKHVRRSPLDTLRVCDRYGFRRFICVNCVGFYEFVRMNEWSYI